MNVNKKKTAWMVCLIVSLTITLTSQKMSTTRGFDFIVLVDQSGSMSGVGSIANNDPLGVRNDMVKRAFELLAKDGVLNKVIHRFGVVSFGSDIRVDLPLSKITHTSVDKLRERLNHSLSGLSLGNTHFIAAFEAAKEMFSTGPRAVKEKKIILLVTDGAPYVEGIQVSSYVRNLRELVKSSFPYPDYKIHVVALNDPSSNYWENYRNFWRQLSHNQARQLEGDREHIFRALHEEINDILGTSAEPVPLDMYDKLVIPPYLESVVFDIFRVNPEVRVDIFPVDKMGQPLRPEDRGVVFVDVGKTIRTVTVKNPAPGLWRIQKSDEEARVDIYMQRFFPRGKLLHPDSDKPIKQFEKVIVKYRVEDGNQQPLIELPGYPLTLELTLIKPDGSRVQKEMGKSSDSSETSVYRTIETVECDLRGEYQTEVLIATKDIKNRQVSLFRDQWSKFQVEGAHLINCNLISPKPFENIPPFGNVIFIPKPLYFKFKFTDEEGESLNLPAFFRGSEKDILTICSKKGNKEQIVPLKFESRSNGILVGGGNHLRTPGTHQLRFSANHAAVPPNYTVRITPDELFFTRNLTLFHWLQMVLAGLLVCLALTLVGYNVFINLRFPLKGRLSIDRLGKRTVAEYSLSQKRHRLILKEFPNETMIKKVIIRSKRDKSGGIIVTVIGEKRKVFLKDRILYDRSTATLKGVPYLLRFRLK